MQYVVATVVLVMAGAKTRAGEGGGGGFIFFLCRVTGPAVKLNQWCFRLQFCNAWLFWAEDNLG